jgi:hypothetical protein
MRALDVEPTVTCAHSKTKESLQKNPAEILLQRSVGKTERATMSMNMNVFAKGSDG